MKLLKWITYLPIAIMASFVATGFINIGGQIVFGWFKFTSAIMCMTSGLFGAFVLIIVSQKIAPKYNSFVKYSLILTLLIIGGFQVANFFIDFGYSGNMILSELTLRSAQSFIGIGLLFGLVLINGKNQTKENINDYLDDNYVNEYEIDMEDKMYRGTIQNIEDFINQIQSEEDTLSIMFNESSDFINIKKTEQYLIISYPTVTDRMNTKKAIFKLAVKTFTGVIDSEDDVILKVRFCGENIEGLKAVLFSTFKLNDSSILDYQLHHEAAR